MTAGSLSLSVVAPCLNEEGAPWWLQARRTVADRLGPTPDMITDDGRSKIAFRALQPGHDIEHNRSSIGFSWQGFDKMDEVSGTGSTELLDDGTIEVERKRSGRFEKKN